MFLERLSRIRSRIGGALALSLIAGDGIPVESVSADSELDIDALSAELMNQLHEMSANETGLSRGPVRRFSVVTDELTIMVGSLSADYYLLLVLGPDGNYGRARFELRRARLLLEKDLV